ncbi:Kae1-associated serine/threonine protein kinase [Candidatus Micrarchaeota archaeon]|nr:Kae1-associated serine/threonine protein kinase [Candidatus Micrarchaeota archaeon]
MIDKGAEAIIKNTILCDRELLEKKRLEKTYREKILDQKLRKERTRTEARILHKVKSTGVLCPVVYLVDNYSIYISKFDGKTLNKLKIKGKEIEDMGKILAKLHSLDIIHSDYTTANIMRTTKGTAVIDFGLSFVSTRTEDKANDIVTLMQDLGVDSKEIKKVIESYIENNGKKEIVERAYDVLKRGRYQKN